jgi:hypothetical protein
MKSLHVQVITLHQYELVVREDHQDYAVVIFFVKWEINYSTTLHAFTKTLSRASSFSQREKVPCRPAFTASLRVNDNVVPTAQLTPRPIFAER